MRKYERCIIPPEKAAYCEEIKANQLRLDEVCYERGKRMTLAARLDALGIVEADAKWLLNTFGPEWASYLRMKFAENFGRFGVMDPRGWTKANRHRLIATVATIYRRWVQLGKPAPAPMARMGSFEAWQNLLGGLMKVVGLTEILANQLAMLEQSDLTTPQWERFLMALQVGTERLDGPQITLTHRMGRRGGKCL